ncbi:FecCD family ABC transporter permease [Enhygromyxa salina]|uniref:FecCD family ABC transporter permease n=1 Tax=Enhygromyxa salina TaxID=215803 RepID=UPI0015E61799|nr:iron ABC transporter permease [Enhygromyxa salina]
MARGPTHKQSALWLAAGLALVLAAGLALTVGPGEFGLAEVLATFGAKLRGLELEPRAEAILWELRLPRVLLSLLIGAGLGSAGAVTQGLFRNPLASPGVLGISTGAAAAVIFGFALGLDEQALWVTPALAGLGALATLGLLFGLTSRRQDLAYLLLTGVALNALAGAVATVILALFLDRYALAQKAMAWMMGSFDGRGFTQLGWASGPILVGMTAAWALHRPLDLLVLGEETAATLGVSRGRLRALAAVVVGLLVGTSTAAVGVIGFVGLVVPHLARSLLGIAGHAHARLLPASMIIGATLMLAVDTLGRALTPTFLAPGALTSLLGGVFFLGLLRRQTQIGDQR